MLITENDNLECIYSAMRLCAGQVALRDVAFSRCASCYTPTNQQLFQIALCERHYVMTMAQHKVSEERNIVE